MTARQTPSPFFLSKRFLETRERWLAQVSAGGDLDWRFLDRIQKDLRQALLEEFHHRCAYCQSLIGVSSLAHIERFYPKGSYPERACDWNNLLACCELCDSAKGTQFPLDENNEPLLFNPRTDDASSHFEEQDDGLLRGVTPKGDVSIQILQLNRLALVESRRNEIAGLAAKLGTKIASIQDTMRKDVGVNNDVQSVEQLTWMLFLKLIDERENLFESKDGGATQAACLPEDLRWRHWTKNAVNSNGDILLSFIRVHLFPRLQKVVGLGEGEHLATIVRTVFASAQNHMMSGSLINQVLARLNEFNLGDARTRRVVGDTYEKLLLSVSRDGRSGAYYMPPTVAQFIVNFLEPSLGETILDPNYGFGSFLVCAFDALRRQAKTSDEIYSIQDSIRGFDHRPLPYMISVVRLMLRGLAVPSGIRQESALAVAQRNQDAIEQVDIVIVNPPFRGIVADDSSPELRPKDGTGLLDFIQLVQGLLKPGGRAAIIVPNGFLFHGGLCARIRETLLKECNVHTIVRLSNEALMHTPIRTNLLLFTKGTPTHEVWYYEHADPSGVRAWWNHRQENAFAWKASIDDIRGSGYNLDRRNPKVEGVSRSFRLVWLKLQAFRGFETLTLELPQNGPTVLIGVNGSGKSTILDAIAMHLSLFVALLRGSPARQAEVPLENGDIKSGEKHATVSVLARVEDDEQVWELRAPRERSAALLAKSMASQARALLHHLDQFQDASIPVLCYYPASRGLGGGSSREKRTTQRFRQLHAYDRAFGRGLGPFEDFVSWFRDEEDAENERRLRNDPSYRSRSLEVVRRGVQGFLMALDSANYSNLRMERLDDKGGGKKTAELVLDKRGVRLSLTQLSEGEKNTLLLVADLASRLAIANPESNDALMGEGVILIDEVDIHLHPAWQRELLPALGQTFPGCQFVVSTHSPQVLGRVHKDHVFIFENFELVKSRPHTFGRDANSILGEVMGVPERPKDIQELIRNTSRLVDEERIEDAKQALSHLESVLGDDDNMVVRIRTLMSFLNDGE